MAPAERNYSSFRSKATLERALLKQKSVRGDQSLARELSERVELIDVGTGQVLIKQGADDHDIYFILAGQFEIIVHGRKIGAKGPGEHVGEMAAILPSVRRSATVQALETGVVAKLSGIELMELAKRHKSMWQHFA